MDMDMYMRASHAMFFRIEKLGFPLIFREQFFDLFRVIVFLFLFLFEYLLLHTLKV